MKKPPLMVNAAAPIIKPGDQQSAQMVQQMHQKPLNLSKMTKYQKAVEYKQKFKEAQRVA